MGDDPERQMKRLRAQCIKLTEQYAQALQQVKLMEAYKEMFQQTREGFCKIRAQYKLLHRERPDIPSWDEILKLAGERGNLLGGLASN